MHSNARCPNTGHRLGLLWPIGLIIKSTEAQQSNAALAGFEQRDEQPTMPAARPHPPDDNLRFRLDCEAFMNKTISVFFVHNRI